ncbi:MAG: putative Flp pilus-assembly TadE/G-like/putative Tad-like Flp pilus-assembly [Acidimicrobiia bacterium]|nr:putative Flp pilus-assembly TadE/G-like/putative Tad-like Flp pilus-assembly [Acidimicrobiia bacterium]
MRLARNRRGGVDEEGGYFLIFVALFLTCLLGFCAFAVDTSHWYLQAQRSQRAADTAALAGVVHMPGDMSGAVGVAQATAAGNGYSSGEVTVAAVPNHPNQLQVSVTHTVTNFFGVFLGKNSETITRTAIAEYQGPVPMGSPLNGMGNEPQLQCDATVAPYTDPTIRSKCLAARDLDVVDTTTQGQYWLNVNAPLRAKGTGDAYQSTVCDTSNDDGCDGSKSPNNIDYREAGYLYRTNVKSAGGLMNLEVFDPAWVNVGDTCSEGVIAAVPPSKTATSSLAGASAIDPNAVPDAADRYATGPGPFCTGDNDQGGAEAQYPMVTTYIVRAPDNTPWNDTDNPVLCIKQFGGYSGTLAPALTPINPAYNSTTVQTYTEGPGGTSAVSGTARVADVFRKWVPLCAANTSNPGGTGDYIIQIKTNAPLGFPNTLNEALHGNGANRFALRSYFSPSLAHGGISISANGALGIFANATGANTTFYLARVMPTSKGRQLNLHFYDTGDAPNPGTLSILGPGSGSPPPANCSYNGPGGADTSNLGSLCQVGNISKAIMNGKWMMLSFQIPTNYTCDPTDPFDCWYRVRLNFPSGTPTDTTSWSADLDGDPVRLIK